MKKIFFSLLAIVLVSCDDNGIRFNIDNSTITQENNKKLYRLTITSDSLEDYYYIQIKEGNVPKRQISLSNIDTCYCITDWHNKKVKKIKFYPNRIYTIENRSDGDCSPGIVRFLTDSKGKPVKFLEKDKSL